MAKKKRKKKQKSSPDIAEPQEQAKGLLDMLHGTDDKEINQQEITDNSDIDKNITQPAPPPPPPPPPITPSTTPSIPQEEQKMEKKSAESSGSFFTDTGVFFSQLGEAYEARYSLWEKSDLTLMAILREIRRINEENTVNFVKVIGELDKKIMKGFGEFLIKRNELERYSDTNYKKIAKNFQKTLDLLNMQIREYQLNQYVNQLFGIYSK